ncbi:MAG TPA: hypothetical protein VGG28_32550 [Kofleriaceae bacterium]
MIDLGPGPIDPSVVQQLDATVVARGLSPAIGDGLGDAFAGIDRPRDQPLLDKALADAQQAYGALDCKATLTAAHGALSVLAGRQAAGMPTPELAKAWTYSLLCADRTNDRAEATRAATQLRALGSPDAPADLLAKYPDIDATLGIVPIQVDVDSEVPNSPIFVDFQAVGTAPVHLALSPGEHVIAAASGTRRGTLVGTPIKSQQKLIVAMPDQASRWSDVALRIAKWRDTMPAREAFGDEISAVLIETHVRVALIRRGDEVVAWGHAGLGERVRQLDNATTLARADIAVGAIAEHVASWSAHAPDANHPLLVEDRSHDSDTVKAHTQWWVYAAVGVALAAAGVVVAVHHYEHDTQNVELMYP